MLAGLVTIAGPCILPLLPIVLGTSTVRQHPSRPLFIILGFILSFSFFALSLSFLENLLNIQPETFRRIAALIIGLFGISMLLPKLQTALFSRLQNSLSAILPKQDPLNASLGSGFLLGASLGLVWTPCAGPVLGSILTLIATKQNIAQAAALLFAYALGAGLPMLAIAYGGQAITQRVKTLSSHTEIIQRVFGCVIIILAIALFTGADRTAQTWLIEHAPWAFVNLNVQL